MWLRTRSPIGNSSKCAAPGGAGRRPSAWLNARSVGFTREVNAVSGALGNGVSRFSKKPRSAAWCEVMNALPTDNLTERFTVPAFIAATFHVVLLFALNLPARPPISDDPPGRVVLRPFPKELLIPPVSDAPSEATAPVQALKPGPVRPVTEDRSTPTPTEISLNPVDAPAAPAVPVDLTTIPRDGWGDGTPGKPTGAPLGAPIFKLDDLDRTPRAKMQPAPEYPLALRQAAIEGQVLVEFDVDVSGRVVSARAVQGTHREFEAAALRAILKWRFEPGRKNGRAVPFRMVVPVGFNLGAD
ncbi:MAG: hypothetical protein C0518_13875 [Opitutus sp.]|nr:hypothetical protein [Opitutus sp.]